MAEDIGKLLLRLTVGGLILLHGLAKISGGVSGISGMLAGIGLPPGLAYGVYVGEVIVVNMLFALLTAVAVCLIGPGRYAVNRR